jgi:hypothetical protein
MQLKRDEITKYLFALSNQFDSAKSWKLLCKNMDKLEKESEEILIVQEKKQ